MSDQETTPEVETAQVADTSTPSPTGPDGQPWDFERQQATIHKLREFETPAKAYERLSSGEDSEEFAKLAEKYGYELAQEEEEDNDAEEWVDPNTSEIAALKKDLADQKAWRDQIEVERQVNAFQSDLTKLSSAEDVELDEDDIQTILAIAVNDPKGLSPDSTKKAFDKHVKILRREADKALAKAGYKPKAPRKPISGEPASQNPSLDSHEDRVAYALERLQGTQS